MQAHGHAKRVEQRRSGQKRKTFRASASDAERTAMEHSGVHHKCVTRFEYHIVGAQAYDHAPLEATDNAVLAMGAKQSVVLSGRVGESVGAEQQVRSLPNNAIAGRVR